MTKKKDKTEECPVCKKFFTTTGIKNHIASCQAKKEKAENPPKTYTPPLDLKDKLPPEKTEQEKADLKKLEETEKYIEQKQEKGENFTPNEIDKLKEVITPLSERQDLRNEVAVETLEARKQEELSKQQKFKEKREGADDISFKDLISLKKIEMLNSKSGGGHSEFIALMQNQNNQQNQIFQMQMKAQDRAHERDMATQKQQHSFMVEQLKTTKEEKSALGELDKFKKLADELNYKKGDENNMTKLISDNISTLPKIIDSISALKNPQAGHPVQTYQNPTSLETPNMPTQEQKSNFPSALETEMYPPPAPVISESPAAGDPINPPIAPMHQPTADEMSPEELKSYAKSHYVEGAESESPFDMYSEMNKSGVGVQKARRKADEEMRQ